MDEDANKTRILGLIREACAALERVCGDDPRLHGVSTLRSAKALSAKELSDVVGCIPAHESLLDLAISNIPGKTFVGLKSALAAAKNQLHWRVDDGGYYATKANVGAGYKNGNMHALLAGPENCPIVAQDFLFGFFLLAPNTLYRDHKHLAPEIYVPLTGPSGWRFDLGKWENHEAGSVIFNDPDIVHATRVCDIPFLSLFVWTRNVRSVCEVVFADDWREIEAELASSPERGSTPG